MDLVSEMLAISLLRDRQHLAEDGILIVVVALDCENNVVVSGPDIVSRGFVYVRESNKLCWTAQETLCRMYWMTASTETSLTGEE